jgi:predicted nucleic acid-binding protein
MFSAKAMNVIVDSGPLVALLDRKDPFHAWSVKTLETLPAPFLVCEAVLTECFHFLNQPTPLLSAWKADDLVVAFSAQEHQARISMLMDKFAPMDFADACVVAMAEMHHPATVVTTDRKDFSRYRVHGRNLIRTLMPPIR